MRFGPNLISRSFRTGEPEEQGGHEAERGCIGKRVALKEAVGGSCRCCGADCERIGRARFEKHFVSKATVYQLKKIRKSQDITRIHPGLTADGPAANGPLSTGIAMFALRRKFRFSLLAAATVLVGCGGSGILSGKSDDVPPVMRWDFRPEGATWTQDVLAAIAKDGQNLTATVPKDLDVWCPGYEKNGPEERAMFWAGALSALAKHESTWNPKASGGGGLWLGLVQIDPRTARYYNCDISSRQDLFDGSKNLACAVKIMDKQVPRGGVVSSTHSPWLGMSADWAPYRPTSKRNEMSAWTSAQAYCAK